MADIKLSALDHLKLVALRGKADANERIAELADAIYAVIEELDGSKADIDHTHESMGGGVPNVTATGDGATYTATADGVTELTKGLLIVITPDTTSTTTLPKLNLNGLGAKNIKQGLSVNTSLTVQAKNADWLVANKPVLLQYDGLQWKTVAVRSSGDDMYGTVPVENGGTGAKTAAAALANLGGLPLPASAEVGQYIRVSEVDENGVPTAVEAVVVETSSGGTGDTSSPLSILSATIPAARVKGDVNGDGVIDNIDAMLVLQHSVGITTLADEALWAADVNGDGAVDNIDAMLIQQVAVGMEAENFTLGVYDESSAWKVDSANKYYYCDIAVAGITETSTVTLIPEIAFESDNYIGAECMAGVLRIKMKCCPIVEKPVRIIMEEGGSGFVAANVTMIRKELPELDVTTDEEVALTYSKDTGLCWKAVSGGSAIPSAEGVEF